MAYEPTNWLDTVKDANGNIIQKGTALNAAKLKKIESGIVSAEAQLAEKAKQADLDTTNVNVSLKVDKTELQAVASGSPKGAYATITDLQTAYPTGNTNIYVITADGNWYYWNGSAWRVGGVYQSTGINENGVKLVNVEFIKGANLFNGVYTNTNLTNNTIGMNLTGIFTAFSNIKSGYTYSIKTVGKHNRFIVYLSNSTVQGSVAVPLAAKNPSTGYEEFNFTNTGNYKYLWIMTEYNVGNIAPIIELFITDNDELKIGSTEVLRKLNYEVKKQHLSIDLQDSIDTFIKGKALNLFNKNNVQNNVFVKFDTGLISSNTAYVTSYLTRIKPSVTYVANFFDQVAFYDINGQYISGVAGYQLGETTFTTPANTHYILISVRKTKINEYQLEEGTVSTPYETSGQKITEDLLATRLKRTFQPKKTIYSITKQLFDVGSQTKIKLIGDSITAGVSGTGYATDGEIIYGSFLVNTSGYCWANSLKGYFESKFNCEVKNWGISGRMSQDLVNNLSTLIQADDDIVICMIGTNDRIDTVDNSTIKLFNNLVTIGNYVRGQGKEIIFMSSVPASVANENVDFVRRFHMEDVDFTVLNAAEHFNVEYISNYKAFMQYCELKDISVDSLLKDGVHPNDAGYDVMFNHICDSLGVGRKRAGATW